ncbi:N-acetylmuramoyl-L-alanine amidase [Bacteroidales bacterium OttesenSCG-928-M11]|nr:N-acetylmuramoyl-L-alanine amidase [Bacteroidales bacterium OttesenSCG-928-M11]
MKKYILLIFLLMPFSFYFSVEGSNKKFILVLDPGHGGKEPGAVGAKSKEKDINLAVTLLVGDMIKKDLPDVEIIYTRNKDTTVSLLKRSQIANNAKADLFISIHANSVKGKKYVNGAEVFTYGQTENKNLEVLKRENEITYLEPEFTPESVSEFLGDDARTIIFEAMQSVFHEHSYDLASMIQNELVVQSKRGNRGVKSDNLAVLRNASMPSVLIELDFISNPDAENYMVSSKGQKQMAKSIYDAFSKYKKKYDLRMQTLEPIEASTNTVEPKSTDVKGIVYKIQILTSSTPVDKSELKGYDADYYIENGLYKYTYGASTDQKQILQLRKQVQEDFKDAFVIAFENGVRIK